MIYTTKSGRSFPVAPPEGWLTLGLVLLLCLAFAWSLDDAQLVLGDPELTDFFTWTAVGGVMAGFLGAMVGWGRWRTFLVGAAFAALLTPLMVGSVMRPDGAPLGVLFTATAEAAVLAWQDLVVTDLPFTTQYGHHLLTLGLIVWGSSMFASFAAFGHRRPLNAILLIGVLLVANMALTLRDQLPYMILYSLAALFLLIRFHTFDEQADWIRRRIGDPTAISALYLRGGTIFIVGAVLGSFLLTKAASSAPLAGAWTDMGGRVIEWSQFLEKYLPVSGSGRSIGPSFGSTASIGGVWTADEGLALTWQSATVLENPPYLAAVVYDDFKIHAWDSGQAITAERPGGDKLLDGTKDAIGSVGRREYSTTITPVQSRERVYAPEMPVKITGDARVRLIGDGYYNWLERPSSSDPYTVTSLIPAEEKDGGVTEGKLRAAGEVYPSGMLQEYGRAAVPEGTFTTPEARHLLDEIVRVVGANDNPYDLALQMVRTLQSKEFTYDIDVRDFRCDLSIVDCFAVNKRGYCEYYATTMAMMLRELDIPARLVEGYLPGEKIGPGNTYQVRNSDSHAWVQVYFPGYGWIDFDPTGGNVAALAPLPSGKPEATASIDPAAAASRGPRAEPTFRDIDEGAGGSITRGPQAPVGPLIAAAVLLAVIVGALSFALWRRGPRGPVSADGAYGMVTRFASRFGFAPKPNQTVYEYAGALAEILPDARPQLETVAQAKVEVAYGGRLLGADRLTSLKEAQRRLRTSLLKLVVIRGRRRKRR